MISTIQKNRDIKIQLIKLMNEKYRRVLTCSFYDFFCNAWEVVWPGIKLHKNWHYKVLADELEKQTQRLKEKKPLEYEALVVNVPFRTAKSTFFTICWNAWAWLHDPTIKFITASYIEELSVEHSFRTRKLLDSQWYREYMLPKFILTGDQNTKSYYENDKGGYRMAISVGRGMGKGGDILIVDDPISREDSLSEKVRKNTLSWMFETLPTRRNDQNVSLIVVVMQRVHQDDPTGAIISKKNGMTYKHICLPSDIEPGIPVVPEILAKKYTNGILFPSAFSRNILTKLRNTLGSYTFNAQCRQMPAPPEGGIFNRTWWKFWIHRESNQSHYITSLSEDRLHTHEQVNLPEIKNFDEIILSGDLGFKKTQTGSRIALEKWGKIGNDKYLIDVIVGRMDYVETRKAVLDFYKANETIISRFLIEDKANGPAIISDLSKDIPVLIGKSPGMESKVERASVVSTSHAVPMSAQCEAGHIYIPHPNLYPWVLDFIEEYAIFPNGSNDDMVDAGTQAVNYWSASSGDIGLYTYAQYEDSIKNEL